MVNLPHPTTAVRLLEQRHADLLAESARDQRAQSAERTGGTRAQRWAERTVTVVAAVVVALLAAIPAAYVALQ